MVHESVSLAFFRLSALALMFQSALTTAALADSSDSGLVRNPSFEKAAQGSSLPADWGGDRNVYCRDEDAGRDGSAALKYVNDDPNRYRLSSQRVSLQPGRKYRLSGWVKTEDLKGEDSGATFCMEWSDRQGKWLGGVYPSGVKGTTGWTLIRGVAEVPEEAGSCTFTCYVRRGMTGKAWFDDVQLVRIIEPPLHSTLTSPVYRGRITHAGPKTIHAAVRLDLRDCEVAPKDLVVRAVLSNKADGNVCESTEQRPRVRDEKTEPMTIELSAQELSPGDYQLEVQLVHADGKVIRSIRHGLTRVADDFQPKCTIDEHRRLLVDGRPFFPLGMYWSSIDEKDIRIYADSKFNCLMPYGSPSREQMDLVNQHGLKVIYSIKDWYAGSRWCPPSIRTAADEEPAVRARVREFRDHPALLAWYLNDELPQDFLPRLETHQSWVAEEDPHHPSWAVLYQFKEVAAYINTFDVIGTDPYPIGRKPASMAAEWTAETFRQVNRSRPMWQVPQLHNWANYQKLSAGMKETHTPTFDEVRSMAWQCIAEGATGLVFYSWYDVKRNPDVSFDEQWPGLKRIAAEIDPLAPAILSIEATPNVTVSGGHAPTWLHWLVRRYQGRLYLFAVNDGDGQGRVKFQLPVSPGTIRDICEDRTIKPSQGVFEDDFDPLALHVYEIDIP